MKKQSKSKNLKAFPGSFKGVKAGAFFACTFYFVQMPVLGVSELHVLTRKYFEKI